MLPAATIAKYLKGNGFKPTLRAVILGAPIPLCSCSVLPVAKALRDKGAGRGPVTGFLISAPETGADAIALSWALLGPIWVIARPVAAIITALTAGLLQPKDGTSNDRRQEPAPSITPVPSVSSPVSVSIKSECCDDCCGHEAEHEIADQSHNSPTTLGKKLQGAFMYGYVSMPTDLARYLLPGIIFATLISMVFPPSSLAGYGSGFPVYLAAILISLPLYVCSTASTPLAASFLAAGVAPGPILAFLLVGPGTNIISFAAVKSLIGLRGFIIQIVVILVVSVACGLVLDVLWSHFPQWFGSQALATVSDTTSIWETIAAILLVGLLAMGIYRDLILKKR